MADAKGPLVAIKAETFKQPLTLNPQQTAVLEAAAAVFRAHAAKAADASAAAALMAQQQQAHAAAATAPGEESPCVHCRDGSSLVL